MAQHNVGAGHDVTEDEMKGLSEEERKAIEAGADAPGEQAEPGEEGEGKPDADAKPAEDKPAAEAKPEPEEREPLAIPFQHDAKIDAKVEQEKLQALQKRYDDGAIELMDFINERDAIRDAIRDDRIKSEMAESSQQQTAMRLWQHACDTFVEEHPAYANPVLYDSLDAAVKRLASDPANEKLSDRQLIGKAHEMVSTHFKVEAPNAAPADPKKALEQKRKPDLSGVPRTLASVPSVADNATADDEFSNLDKLAEDTSTEGQMRYERALASLPTEKADRYLRGGAAA